MFLNASGGRKQPQREREICGKPGGRCCCTVYDGLQCSADDRQRKLKKSLIISNKSMHLFAKKYRKFCLYSAFSVIVVLCSGAVLFLPSYLNFECWCFLFFFFPLVILLFKHPLKKKRNSNLAVICHVHIFLRQSFLQHKHMQCSVKLKSHCYDNATEKLFISSESVTLWSFSDSTQTSQLLKR